MVWKLRSSDLEARGNIKMSVIQVSIDDALIQAMGLQAVQAFMERQLARLRAQHLGRKIAFEIEQAGFKHEDAVKEARHEAWHDNYPDT